LRRQSITDTWRVLPPPWASLRVVGPSVTASTPSARPCGREVDSLRHLLASIEQLLVKGLGRRKQRANAGHPDTRAVTMFESFKDLLDDSAKRVECVLGLEPTGPPLPSSMGGGSVLG
jgi:hypothetical protein